MFLISKVLLITAILCSLNLCQVFAKIDFPPAGIQKCHISDEKCLVEQGNNFLRAYPHGNAELGMPDLEPFVIEKLNILGDDKAAANINLFMTDLKFYNFSTMALKKFRGFSKDTTKPMKILAELVLPQMTLKAKYKVSGKVLLLPIAGEGDMEWIISDINVRTKTMAMLEERDGKSWLKITEHNLITTYKDVKINMTNLFNGDKNLSDNMMELFNKNWKIITAEVTPQVDDAMRDKVLIFFNKLYELVPYDDFFLSD